MVAAGHNSLPRIGYARMRLPPGKVHSALQTSWLDMAFTSWRRGEGKDKKGEGKEGKREATEGDDRPQEDWLGLPWNAVALQALLARWLREKGRQCKTPREVPATGPRSEHKHSTKLS